MKGRERGRRAIRSSTVAGKQARRRLSRGSTSRDNGGESRRGLMSEQSGYILRSILEPGARPRASRPDASWTRVSSDRGRSTRAWNDSNDSQSSSSVGCARPPPAARVLPSRAPSSSSSSLTLVGKSGALNEDGVTRRLVGLEPVGPGQPDAVGGLPVTVDAPDDADDGGESMTAPVEATAAAARAAIDGPLCGLMNVRQYRLHRILTSVSMPRIWRRRPKRRGVSSCGAEGHRGASSALDEPRLSGRAAPSRPAWP